PRLVVVDLRRCVFFASFLAPPPSEFSPLSLHDALPICYPLLALSGSVGTVVAVLALAPPWVLLYLVSGKEGMKGGWPFAVVGSLDRKSTRLNSSHLGISYAVFCLKKKMTRTAKSWHARW